MASTLIDAGMNGGLLPEDEAARDQALETQGSFIVQAPAGSGKTELLTQRFLKLLAVVDEPEQILAITFTRAATAEMRARVLDALKKAQLNPETAGDAARAALKNDAARGWKLLEQPHRLTIQTIDSLCLTIASETPLLSRLGGSLAPTEHAQPLYALAARRTLARLGGDHGELSAAIRALLELRDTSLADCEQLIAGILAQRDQWGSLLSFGSEPDWPVARDTLEAPFRREHERVMAQAGVPIFQLSRGRGGDAAAAGLRVREPCRRGPCLGGASLKRRYSARSVGGHTTVGLRL